MSPVNPYARAIGLLLAIVGNVMVFVSFPRLINGLGTSGLQGPLNNVATFAVGSALASVGIRYVGVKWSMIIIFMSTGLGPLLRAFHGEDRFFGFLFGGIFVGLSLLMVFSSLVFGGLASVSIGAAGGRGVYILGRRAEVTPEMLKAAETQIQTLKDQGKLTDEQLASALTSLRGLMGGAGAPIEVHPEAAGHLDNLHANGVISKAQLNAVKRGWGIAPPR